MNFGCGTVATLVPRGRWDALTGLVTSDPKPWGPAVGFDLGGGQLRNQTVVDRAAKRRRRRRSLSSQDVSDRHASPQGKHSAEDHGTASGEDEVVRAAVALIPGVDEGSINVVTARRDGTSQSPSSELPARVDPSSPSSVKDRAWTPSSKSSPSECPTCVRRNAGPTSPVTDRGRSCEQVAGWVHVFGLRMVAALFCTYLGRMGFSPYGSRCCLTFAMGVYGAAGRQFQQRGRRVTVAARGRYGLGRRSPEHLVGSRRTGWWTPRRRRRRAGSCPSRRS